MKMHVGNFIRTHSCGVAKFASFNLQAVATVKNFGARMNVCAMNLF